MLTGLEITDYESHKHSTFDFTAGVNLLWGDSDAGKSSVVRAIAVVAYNRWDEEMLRVGTKHSKIKLTSDRGYVKTIRGGGKNEWEIRDEVEGKTYNYEKVGKTVPEIVTKVLGMPQIEFGAVTDFPNIMFQLDKHYMISEIDGKKCSGNMVAQMIDGIFGLTGVEELINKISSEGLKSKKRLNENVDEIKLLEAKLHKDSDIDEKKNLIDKCNVINKELKEDKILLRNIGITVTEMDKIKNKLLLVMSGLEQYENLDKIEEKHLNMRDSNDILNAKSKYYESYIETKGKLETTAESLKDLKDIEKSEKILADLKQECDLYKKMVVLFDERVKVKLNLKTTLDKLDKLPNMLTLTSLYEDIRENEKIYSNVVELWKKQETINKSRNTNKEELLGTEQSIIKSQEEKQEIIKNNPECPTCGQSLENSHLCKEIE